MPTGGHGEGVTTPKMIATNVKNIHKMLLLAFTILSLLFPNTVSASPTPSQNLFERTPVHLNKRATCTPTGAQNAGTDDVPAIVAAIKSCGSGGIIKIPAGITYAIRSVLSFNGCSNCEFQVEGTLKVSDDTSFWNGQSTIISVDDVSGLTFHSVTGSGVLDGNGQASYDLFAQDSTFKRPTLQRITGTSKNINISNLKVKNPPNVFFSTATGTTNVAYSSLTLTANSKTTYPAKNTDGFDVSGSYVTLKNVTVQNQDDCIAFKPGADYVTVDGITCSGSHGLSVGSLGASSGKTDTVSNVYVTNAIMIDSTKAVGIKLYPGGSSHGTSVVKNVTYDGVTVDGCGYAVQVQSCYNEDASYCASTPSTGQITDVYFKNFKGTTDDTYSSSAVANINCPTGGSCGIQFSGWSVTPPSGKAVYQCANTPSNIGITCSSGASGR